MALIIKGSKEKKKKISQSMTDAVRDCLDLEGKRAIIMEFLAMHTVNSYSLTERMRVTQSTRNIDDAAYQVLLFAEGLGTVK